MIVKWMAIPGIALLAAQACAADPSALTTQRDRVNYAIGVNIVTNLKQQGIEIEQDLVIKGMKDSLAGGKLQLNDEELRIAIDQYQTAVRQKRSLLAAETAKKGRREVKPLPPGAAQKAVKD